MAITTYPLNGIDYYAENAETYLCTRTSGVYSADDNFQASVTGDRQITISKGLAWIKNAEAAGKSVYNDSDVALDVPIADGLRDRIYRIVLKFDKALNASVIELKPGELSTNPKPPAVDRSELVYELGLYTVRVKAGSTVVTAADITSTLLDETVCGLMRDGVTGLPTQQIYTQLETLLAEMHTSHTEQLERHEQEFQEALNQHNSEAAGWLESANQQLQRQEQEFDQQTNRHETEFQDSQLDKQTTFQKWFEQLQASLEPEVAVSLANQILKLQERTKILEEIVDGIRTEFTVYNKLYDNGYENYDNLLDSSEGTIIDSNVDPIVARAYFSSLILDSNGQPIDGRVIFCIR